MIQSTTRTIVGMPVNAHLDRVVKATREAAAALLGEARREVRAAGRYIVQRKIRLGVTGLSRAGKTVFVTSLIQNMRLAKSDKTRLPFLGLAASDQLINVRVAKIPGVTPFPLRSEERRVGKAGRARRGACRSSKT